MYNNRALVPEHGEHFARWARDSEVARRAGPVSLDVPYGAGPLETLDVFPASMPRSAKTAAPVMVFVHGGYWRSLDKADHSFVAPAFTRQGVCVVVINYALCPAVTVSDICLQTAQALAWVWRNIAQHGGDPSRVTVVGHSAGGHLALWLASRNDAQVRVGTVVALAAVADLRAVYERKMGNGVALKLMGCSP